MPTTGRVSIQIKRGPEIGLPALEDGELAWTTDTHKLFIGQDRHNYEVILNEVPQSTLSDPQGKE